MPKPKRRPPVVKMDWVVTETIGRKGQSMNKKTQTDYVIRARFHSLWWTEVECKTKKDLRLHLKRLRQLPEVAVEWFTRTLKRGER